MTRAVEEETSSRRPRSLLVVKVLFGVAVIAFGVAFVAARWDKVSAALQTARPGWVALALVLGGLGQWAASFGFGALLHAVSRSLPTLEVARVYFVSQLGKYLPGSVWPIVVVTSMCQKYGIPRRAAVTSGLLAMVFSVATAGLVGITLVVFVESGDSGSRWWLLAIIPLAALCLHPRVIVAATDRLVRLARRPPLEMTLSGRTLVRAIGWPIASWILLGLQCWALVVALGGDPIQTLAPAIGGFALAYAAGTLFVPAPAGAGVREAVLAVALTGTIEAGSTFTNESVIVVVLLSRVLLAVLDFAQAGAVLAWRWLAGRVS